MKKLFALLLTLVLGCTAFFATGCSSKELNGFDIELARAVSEKLGVKVTFKEIDWDVKEEELNQGKIDCVWNGFTYTKDRDNGYYDEDRKMQIGGLDFTGMYMKNKQVAVVKKNNAEAAKSADWFKDKKGCAEATSAGESVITDVFKAKANQLGRQLDIFTGVEAGSFDYGVLDSVMANYYVAEGYKDKLAVVEIAGVEEEFYSIAFKEGSNLVGVFNYILAGLYADGTAKKIATTYGLENVLYNGFGTQATDYAYPTDGAYKALKDKGELVIGYTIFAPIAYTK